MKTQYPNNTSISSKINVFFAEMELELTAILSWWESNMKDIQNGGFYGKMDGHGKIFPTADKGVIQHTRLLWTFSAAAIQTGNEAYKKIAEQTFRYIISNFIDDVYGGVYWSISATSKVKVTKKQIYAQAFAIYAFSEYYRLTKDVEALQYADEIFFLIEKYSFDTEKGGYLEAFSKDWQLLDDLRLSDKDINEAKTMNTHLHILEAYTNLYRAQKTEIVKKALSRLIQCFLDQFINPFTHHLHLFFNEDWHLKSSAISYGHDIECSWLLYEAVVVLGDETLMDQVHDVTIEMANATLHGGVKKDHSLIYEKDGMHTDHTRHWWPQAEAVIGFWNAWKLSGDFKYQEASLNCWEFIKSHILNKEVGEWHWSVNEQYIPDYSQDVAGSWKSPYHNGRMCLEIMNRRCQ